MRAAALICVVCVVVVLSALAARNAFSGGPKRDRAIARASAQLGTRTSEIIPSVFWLVNADPSNLETMRAGRVPKFSEGAGGLATAIDPAGYFLTAAHAVYGDTYLFGKFGDRLEARKAGVVFQGDGRTPADDFCILRVEGPVASVLPLAARRGEAGAVLYSVVRDRDERVVVAGRIEKTREAPASVRAIDLQTDFPLAGGDSGGPVLNDQGEVIGVTSSAVRSRLLRIQSAGLACCPVRSFVEGVIRKDQATRRVAEATPASLN